MRNASNLHIRATLVKTLCKEDLDERALICHKSPSDGQEASFMELCVSGTPTLWDLEGGDKPNQLQNITLANRLLL